MSQLEICMSNNDLDNAGVADSGQSVYTAGNLIFLVVHRIDLKQLHSTTMQ